MASLWSLSSVYLSQNPSPLRHTSKASPCVRFGSPKTNEVRVPVCRVSAKRGLPNLQADHFLHPVDSECIRRIRQQPNMALLEKSTQGLVESYLEDGYFPSEVIEDDDTSVLAGPTEHSDTYKLMAETAEILNITAPLLFIRNNDKPFACSVGLDIPYIIVHSCLLQLLTPQELQAVLAHELAHLKCGHYVLHKLIDKIVLAVESSPEFGQIPLEEFFRWYHASELSCDRASLLVVQDTKVVVSSIMKLADGYPSMVEEAEVDRYLAAAHAYAALSSSKDALSKEPAALQRAYEVDVWSKSEEYKSLLTGAKVTKSAAKK